MEIIIIDTSGRHRQEQELFSEMKEISQVAKPDNIIFVMDAAIGQAADLQARAFSESVEIGSIIVTKMDGGAKGGGAISGVAATGSPIIFIGTGEHIYDLERFTVTSFVNKMLGYGDISGIMETVSDLNKADTEGLAEKLEKGIFTLREMQSQFQMIIQMGPVSKVMSMLPGMTAEMFKGNDQDVSRRMKRFMAIMDSMTSTELDSDGKQIAKQASRARRITAGSGTFVDELHELLSQYAKFAQLVKGMGGAGNGLFKPSANGQPDLNAFSQQLSKMVPPEMMRQLGGTAGLSGFMKQFEGMNK